MLIKKYSNRRLYVVGEGRYVTQEELADRIRKGTEVTVVDARSNEDLTQATLAQIILESRGASKLLPVPLLTQLIRMGDDHLAEFLGRYLTAFLEMYLQAKRGMQVFTPFYPVTQMPFQMPFSPASVLGKLFGGTSEPSAPPAPSPPAESPEPARDDLASLRREIEELKKREIGRAHV